MDRELYMEFFQISVNTFYLWKKQKRPVIEFFSKYYTDEEIKEFLETGRIQRQELMKDFNFNDFENFKVMKKQFILDEINKKQQEIEELKSKLDVQI